MTGPPHAKLRDVEHEASAPRRASAWLRRWTKDPGENAQVVRGSGYTLAARLAMAASRGVGLILISRTLGAADFGTYSLLIAAFALSASAGTLGMDQAHTYFSGSRRQDPARMLRNAGWLAVALGVAAGFALLGATHILRERIFDATPRAAELLTAASLPAIVYQNYLQGMAIGRSWFRLYSAVEISKWTLHVTILALCALFARLSIVTALAALYVPIMLAACVYFVALMRAERLALSQCFGLPSLSEARQSLHYGVRACSLHFSHVLHLRMDLYLLKYFTSAVTVGQYALAVNITDVILYGGRSVGLVVLARRSGASSPRAGVTPRVTRVMLVVVGSLATAVLLGRTFLVETFFGAAFLACTGAIALRLPGILAESLSVVLVSDFLGRAHARSALIMTCAAVLLSLALNMLLIPVGGMIAAACVFSLASWVRVIGMIGFHTRLACSTWREYVWREPQPTRAERVGLRA